MERLLTTKDLQHLLQVDRLTIYRMLESGELPGIKVGGQWRFPEQAMHDWLQGMKLKQAAFADPGSVVRAMPSSALSTEMSHPPRLTEIVSSGCLQNIQDGFAEAVGVASLVMDLDGIPLTTISGGCDFCRLGWTSDEFRRRCLASWASLDHVDEQQPGVHLCHAGIGYAVAAVQVHELRVGLVVGGQFWSERPNQEHIQTTAARLASECGLSEAALIEAAGRVPVFGQERVLLMTKLLATIADAVSEIGFQAYEVRQKLHQIAQIVKSL